jgi:hypothetical protein
MLQSPERVRELVAAYQALLGLEQVHTPATAREAREEMLRLVDAWLNQLVGMEVRPD